MRFLGMLALLGVGAISLAIGDPSTTGPAPAEKPADTQAAPAAAAAQTNPAAAIPAATPAKPAALSPEEKRLIAQGYRPEMRHGEKVYCKTEEELGTRLGMIKHCGTPASLNDQHAVAREELQYLQRDRTPVLH